MRGVAGVRGVACGATDRRGRELADERGVDVAKGVHWAKEVDTGVGDVHEGVDAVEGSTITIDGVSKCGGFKKTFR